MAAAIPASMKAADIARFAQRAGQVEKAKPVIAYWCEYVFESYHMMAKCVQAITG